MGVSCPRHQYPGTASRERFVVVGLNTTALHTSDGMCFRGPQTQKPCAVLRLCEGNAKRWFCSTAVSV